MSNMIGRVWCHSSRRDAQLMIS